MLGHLHNIQSDLLYNNFFFFFFLSTSIDYPLFGNPWLKPLSEGIFLAQVVLLSVSTSSTNIHSSNSASGFLFLVMNALHLSSEE